MAIRVFWLSVLGIFILAGSGLGGELSSEPVQGQVYYDMATGHKYLKNQDTTYFEFSRKGELLRQNVSNDLPLLVSGRNILEITDEHYLIYEKGEAGQIVQQVLPAFEGHPRGWQCKQILSEVQKREVASAEAYDPAD